MTNMSYCRFRNTLLALQDCKDALETEVMEISSSENDHRGLSIEEHRAMKELIRICSEIAEDAPNLVNL